MSVTTVAGMAGVGKTALVVRAARTSADAHPDGCLFVELHAHGPEAENHPHEYGLSGAVPPPGEGS